MIAISADRYSKAVKGRDSARRWARAWKRAAKAQDDTIRDLVGQVVRLRHDLQQERRRHREDVESLKAVRDNAERLAAAERDAYERTLHQLTAPREHICTRCGLRNDPPSQPVGF